MENVAKENLTSAVNLRHGGQHIALSPFYLYQAPAGEVLTIGVIQATPG